MTPNSLINKCTTSRRTVLAMAAAALCEAGFGSITTSDAHAANIDTALTRVTKARASIKTLQAPFKQTRVIGLLASEVKSKGKLTLVRPHRLRWELFPPDAVTYWIGPEGLAIANKEGVTKVSRASAGRFAAVLGDLLVMLGGDLKQLKKRYTLSVDDTGGRFVLTATPKAKDVKKHITRLMMEAGEQLWSVKRIEIEERNGDRSIIRFGKFVRDKPVKPAVMKPPTD